MRQDPNDADLLFLGTKSTVYASFDGGERWQPLGLNLPHVQVRDLAINTRQGAVAIATHGRAFWVLDNLALLEQLTKPSVDFSGAQLFAPETAWLTHAYGSNPYGKDKAGENPPFGATVFFTIPAGYDGKTPASLAFTDAQGHLIRSFALHRKNARAKMDRAAIDRLTPTQQKMLAQQRLTAIRPGANAFQWDLRYDDAVEVNGFNPPIAAGGLPDEVNGPTVVPGTYHAVLEYGGRTMTQSFTVALDPRLHVAPGALAARLALGLRIRTALDTLDTTINQAIGVRDALDAAITRHRLTQARARNALRSLNGEIGDLVQLQILSSEGSLLHETKLRSHLAYLAADIDLAYEAPTDAQYAVFDRLIGEAKAGERRLTGAMAAGKRLL